MGELIIFVMFPSPFRAGLTFGWPPLRALHPMQFLPRHFSLELAAGGLADSSFHRKSGEF
jgi:hypothetical protein